MKVRLSTDADRPEGQGITGIAYVHLLDEREDTKPPAAAKDGVVEITLRPSAMDDIFESAAILQEFFKKKRARRGA